MEPCCGAPLAADAAHCWNCGDEFYLEFDHYNEEDTAPSQKAFNPSDPRDV